jgi:SAM-dependent methyltransferase
VKVPPLYDRIGSAYSLIRREDPRIAERIRLALGASSTVVNVGAGTGSYEPVDRMVVAVDPSALMLSQRRTDAAPAVRAAAEALPFQDDAFDAAMAVLTLHHWGDKERGLAEMRRVARGPVVLFAADPDLNTSWWLHRYFPSAKALGVARTLRPQAIAAILGGTVEVTPVPIPGDCWDGFEGAYWRRPHAILDSAVWRGISLLSLIPDRDRRQGMRDLAADLDSGRWHRTFGYLLNCSELDVGYRLFTAYPSVRSAGPSRADTAGR